VTLDEALERVERCHNPTRRVRVARGREHALASAGAMGTRAMSARCPNPRCEDGSVPGGSKGWLLCPDCKGDPMAKTDADFLRWCAGITGATRIPACGMKAVVDRLRELGVVDLPGDTLIRDLGTLIPPAVGAYLADAAPSVTRSYPDAIENPVDPPSVGGTEITRPTP
jgi:hypothetical protein